MKCNSSPGKAIKVLACTVLGANLLLSACGGGGSSSSSTETAVSKRPLNDTGLIWSGNFPSGNNDSCTGDIVAEQDCSHGRDVSHPSDSDGHAGFSFTKLDAYGNALLASAEDWACVRDNVTGLVWEVKTRDGGIHDTSEPYRWGGIGADAYGATFHDDWNKLVEASNEQTLCGFTDWRVPQVSELYGIVNLYPLAPPSIDASYFPNTLAGGYWTKSADVYDRKKACHVQFRLGGIVSCDADRGEPMNVRLVRSSFTKHLR